MGRNAPIPEETFWAKNRNLIILTIFAEMTPLKKMLTIIGFTESFGKFLYFFRFVSSKYTSNSSFFCPFKFFYLYVAVGTDRQPVSPLGVIIWPHSPSMTSFSSSNAGQRSTMWPHTCFPMQARFESMSFVVNILACKLKIVNNRNWKKT